jgi:YD repeat-containing protein
MTGSIQGSAAPVGHDNDGYGATFITGRANLSSVKRYDVTDTSVFTTSSIKYNTAGAVVDAANPLSHHTLISYADSFSDGNNSRNTLAYPKTVTDGDGYSSTTIYNFDFGAVTSKQTPQPNITQNLPGPIQTFTYDAAGRIERITATTNSAYTRYVYGPTYVQSFATINTVADEAYSNTIFDGLGRTFLASRNHPGSGGGYGGQHTIYDSMGRAKKQSNPTEITSAWQPAGDDVAGWLYTQQTYDWKGRPLVTTNTDGTTKEASYTGCGCAGGKIATLTDEGTIDGGVAKRRQQKVYSDILGRTVKTEVLNWQGGSVYATTVNTYNGRDQVTGTRQYQGTEDSEGYQETTMAYDGYGRLKTKHIPQQDANTATTFNYNDDDTALSVVDARGASQTFSYNNNRQLVTGIAYAAPGSVPTPSNVSFAYDAVGNRTSMTDGLGGKTYQYDQLSRLTSETRTISGVGTYPLSYAYNLADELTSITDPFGAQLGYSYDTIGRVDSVTGTNFASVPTYASNMKYRAWGGLKELDYGNTRTLAMTYNSRLQPASFTVTGVISKTYDYQPDGRRSFSHDLIATKFDRSYKYDHAGRITEALSGPEARNEGTSNLRPYKQTFSYDPFGHMVERPVNLWWSGGGGGFEHQEYQNERNVNWGYDADGNLPDSGEVQYTIDAAGRTSKTVSTTESVYGDLESTVWGYSHDVTQGLDGDGQAIRKVVAETTIDYTEGNTTTTKTQYLVRSSVLKGQVLTEMSDTGQKQRTFVYLGTQVLAIQRHATDNTQSVVWEHRDPGNASYRVTGSSGTIHTTGSAELDPLGTDAGTSNPIPNPTFKPFWSYPGFGNTNMASCILDGVPMPCSEVSWLISAGAAGLCPYNNCGPHHDSNRDGTGRGGWVLPTLLHNGFSNEPIGPSTPSPKSQPPTLVPFDPSGPFDPDIEQPQNSDFNMPGIAKWVDLELAESDCLEFAGTVLNSVSKGKGGSLADAFNAFLGQSKTHDLFTRIRPEGSRGEATLLGKLKDSTASMYLRKSDVEQTWIDADNVIQELFHLVGDVYSDEQLARGLLKTAYSAEAAQVFPDGTANIFDKRYIARGWSKADGYSTYFHAIAHIHCGLRSPNTYKKQKK